MATEIYSCKDGQALKEGKLDYSGDINTKEEAEADAKRRCQRDTTLKRIAYYAVDEAGRFRNFCTYNNPNAQSAAAKVTTAAKPRRAPPKPAPKPTLWGQIKASLGLS